MEASELPTHIHLVGSIGLHDSSEVFRTVGRLFGRRLKRVPDGEPAGRALWVSWQYPVLNANPFLAPSGAINSSTKIPLIGLAPGVRPEDLKFGELGYAREARASYQDFLAARDRGDIAPGTRFQISMPTPFEVLFVFADRSQIDAIEPAYERAFIAEVEAICAAIPHRDLCIQWDICHQMVIWDGQSEFLRYPVWTDIEKEVTTRLERLCRAVPDDVELGFHLCYGDYKARHFVDPRDAGALVEVANAIARHVSHRIAYIHMPVPIARSDDAYFAPLAKLALPSTTEVYLGLVHADGAEANQRRLQAARKYLRSFGVATECGMARARVSEVVNAMLKSHLHVCREPASG